MLTFSVNKNINDAVSTGALSFDMPTTRIGREWLSEVVVKTLADKIDEKVNVDAYGYVCERNTNLHNGSKEVALLTAEELQAGLRGVADTVASYLDLNVDMIVESSEVRTLVIDFIAVHENLLIEEGVNLLKVIKLAREGKAKMVNKLKDLIERHDLSDLIEGVLGNRECLSVLEAQLA